MLIIRIIRFYPNTPRKPNQAVVDLYESARKTAKNSFVLGVFSSYRSHPTKYVTSKKGECYDCGRS